MPRYYAGLVKVEVYLPEEMYTKIEELRKEVNMSLSGFIRYLLDLCLMSIERGNERGEPEKRISED
ncbi:MAG: hypothetical protein ACXQTR_03425 [Candidatus Methanospirareceae archaeon]